MRRTLTIAGSFLLILAAVCCTMGALISAFSFDVELRLLFAVWLIAAFALSVSVSLLRGKGLLILLLPALIALLWMLPEIAEGGKWAIFRITSEYNKWLYVPVIFAKASASSRELTLFFAIAGVALTFLVSASVCLQRSAFLTVFYTAPLVFLTVVLVETQADVRFFLGLMAVYLTLAISSSLHPDNFLKRGTSLFPALALSAILLVAAYLVAPPDSYRRGGLLDEADSYLRGTAEQIGVELNKKGVGWPQSMSSRWLFTTDSVGISDAGARTVTDRSLLEITAEQTGTFYLRGFSMLSFERGEWRGDADTMSPFDESVPRRMPAVIVGTYNAGYAHGSNPGAEMTIAKTGDSSDLIYQPYYSFPLSSIDSYPYSVFFDYTEESVPGLYNVLSSAGGPLGADRLASFDEVPWFDMSDYNAQMRSPSVYTQIEESTAEGLRELAMDAGIDPAAGRAEVADMVAEYVSSSARYTLTPYITPEGEDFALYFLRTSKRGYCIHFATAATLMLRALDIPARFTSGFVVTVRASAVGAPTVVTDRNAHAWVEVYYEDIGWVPLETTPAFPGSGIPGRTAHSSDVAAPYLDLDEPETDDGQPENPLDAAASPDGSDSPDGAAEPAPPPGASEAPTAQSAADSPKPLGSFFSAAVIASVCIVAVIAYSAFLGAYRKKRLAQPDGNEAVIYAWRLISFLAKYEKPPEALENLALKARFSQHRITENERAEMFEGILSYCAGAHKRRNLVTRLRIRHILAALPIKSGNGTFS